MKCEKCNHALAYIGKGGSNLVTYNCYICTNCDNVKCVPLSYHDTSHFIFVKGSYKNKQLEGLYINGCLIKCNEHLSLSDIIFFLDKNLDSIALYNVSKFFAKKRKLELPEKFSEIPDKYLSHIN